MEKILRLDLEGTKSQFEICQQRWEDDVKVLEREKEEYETRLKTFMEEQQKLIERIFKSNSLRVGYVNITTRKLPLFGQQVSDDQIDFNWSAEEFIKANGGLEKIKLSAIKFGKGGANAIGGLQLLFTGVGEIRSPRFGAKNFDESKLTKSPFTKNENVTKVKVRVDRSKYLHEMKFYSGENEILTSNRYDTDGSYVEQNIGAEERIIGVYGVKNEYDFFSSLGFIVGKKEE